MPSTHVLRRAFVVAVAVVACWPLAAQKKPPASAPAPILLPELQGTVNSQARDVNDGNVIVGTMWDAADVGTAVAWVPTSGGWRIVAIGSGQHPAGPFPAAVNKWGEVLLNRFDGVDRHASVYMLDGGSVDLPIPAFTPGATSTTAVAIDDYGMVLGTVLYPTDPITGTSSYQPVVWVKNGGQWTAVALDAFCHDDDPGLWCDYADISKHGGWIAGEVARPGPNGAWGWAARAMIRGDGVMGQFTPLGSDSSILSNPPRPPLSGALAVNANGQCAGYYWPCPPDGSNQCTSQAAFWDVSSGAVLLPTLQPYPARSGARANGINDAGDVVGWATFARSGTYETAAAWWKYKAQPPVKLAAPKPYSNGEAVAINNTGLAVGTGWGPRPHAIAWKLK